MKLTTDSIRGINIEIEVDSSGRFSAEFGDNEYTAATRKELLEQLDAAVKKSQQQGSVDVSVVGLIKRTERGGGYGSDGPYVQGAGVVHAKLRAKHSRQWGTWLLVSDDKDKQKFQVSGSRSGIISRRLSDEETATYIGLHRASLEAQLALETYEKAIELNPEDALKDAVVPDKKAKASK